MWLFLYGTLLAADRWRALTGRELVGAPAALAGWRRVCLRGTLYPTLARDRGRVSGLLVRADPGMLRRLAVYEGARYRLRRVGVRCRGRTVAAHAWIGDAPTRRQWP